MNESEDKEALGLYVVLARDIEDFIDMLDNASNGGLKILYLMLTTPNPNASSHDSELNKLGASFLKRVLEGRGIVVEKIAESIYRGDL
jgi:hypothetical protein